MDFYMLPVNLFSDLVLIPTRSPWENDHHYHTVLREAQNSCHFGSP